MVSMLSYSLMSVVDTLFVGQLGTEPLAAVGASACLVHLAMAFPNGLLGGARVQVAHAVGADELDRARRSAWQGIWLAGGLGVLIASLAPLAGQGLGLLGVSDAVAELGWGYVVVRVLGAPVVFASMALGAWFQGRGQTRVPMVANVLGNLTNIALDPLLIFGWGPVPALGVTGAALATVVGIGVGVVVLVVAARPLLRRPCGLDRSLLAAVWRVGAPQGVQYTLDVGSFTVFASLLAFAGDVHLAAHVVVVRIILVTFLPCLALGQAAGVLVGQALGADRPERARRAVRLAALQGVGIMAVMAVVFVTVPDALTGVFGAEATVQALARQVLLLYAAIQVFDALAVVGLGALGGAGDTRFVLWLSVGMAWGVKIPVATVLVRSFGWGVVGAWSGLAVELLCLTVVVWARLSGRAWLRQLEPSVELATA
jgi:MATE family multidrug resistance protein